MVKSGRDFDSKPFPFIFTSAIPELYNYIQPFCTCYSNPFSIRMQYNKTKNKEYCTVGTILKENIRKG